MGPPPARQVRPGYMLARGWVQPRPATRQTTHLFLRHTTSITRVRVLLTNDDGIEAAGLQALRQELLAVPGIDLAVIAPDGNRSAMARSITTRRPLWVQEVEFGDGTIGYATDGTPVDCVRLARLGLIEGFEAELVVSGINHGSNLGDDITYSGTVAAALEAIVLGLPGIAVSQQSRALELDFRVGVRFDFDVAARFTARLVSDLEAVPLPSGTLLNINVPGTEPLGVEVARLGKRIYRDELSLMQDRVAGVCTASTATPAMSARRREPTWRRSIRGGSRSRRSTSISPITRAWMPCALTTWRA